MTDLSKIAEEVRKSKVKLTKEFWDKQNKIIRDNQERFSKISRELNIHTCL